MEAIAALRYGNWLATVEACKLPYPESISFRNRCTKNAAVAWKAQQTRNHLNMDTITSLETIAAMQITAHWKSQKPESLSSVETAAGWKQSSTVQQHEP